MPNKRVIPCLDLKNGRVVKGIQFETLIDAGDPVANATRYQAEGADELVFLDIAASSENRGTMLDVVSQLADAINIPFTVGGGIRNLEDAGAILAAGASKISLSSAALKNPALINQLVASFGSERIVLAIDAKRVDSNRWEVYRLGGREASGLDALEWAQEVESRGAGELLLTSIDRDGTRDGYDLELLSAVKRVVKLPLIASGGAGSLEDFALALTEGGADAVLAASLFHFKVFSIPEVKAYLSQKGLKVKKD